MSLNKTQRWIAILDLLFSKGRGLTCVELVEELNRRDFGRDAKLRDVQRDLKEMSEWDVAPVSCDASSPVRWSLDTSRLTLFSKRFALTPEAATTIAVALEHMEMLLPPAAFEDLAQSKVDALQAMERFSRDGRRPWLDKVLVLPDSNAARLRPRHEIKVAVYESVMHERQVRVEMLRPDDSGSGVLNPLGLTIVANRVQLVAHQGQGPLVVELHRMTSAEVLSSPAIPLDGFSLQEFVASHDPRISGLPRLSARAGEERFVAIVSESLKRYWELAPLDETQVLERAGNEWRIEANAAVVSTVFERFLLAHAGDVQVLSPSALRSRLVNHAQEILARHA